MNPKLIRDRQQCQLVFLYVHNTKMMNKMINMVLELLTNLNEKFKTKSLSALNQSHHSFAGPDSRLQSYIVNG